MNFFKTTIFAISAVALTLGFASCSDDDDDKIPTPNMKTVWTVTDHGSEIVLTDQETENPELIEAVEAAINESPSILKSVTFFTDGKYEAEFNGGKESGTFEATKDSVKLIVKSTMEAGNTLKNRAYGFEATGENKMALTEDISNEFAEFEGVEKVLVTFNAEGESTLVAEPYN